MITSMQYNRLNLHVSASNREVVAAAHRLLRNDARRSSDSRKGRHEWLRCILACHAEAQKVYRDVMSGNLSSDYHHGILR